MNPGQFLETTISPGIHIGNQNVASCPCILSFICTNLMELDECIPNLLQAPVLSPSLFPVFEPINTRTGGQGATSTIELQPWSAFTCLPEIGHHHWGSISHSMLGNWTKHASDVLFTVSIIVNHNATLSYKNIWAATFLWWDKMWWFRDGMALWRVFGF